MAENKSIVDNNGVNLDKTWIDEVVQAAVPARSTEDKGRRDE